LSSTSAVQFNSLLSPFLPDEKQGTVDAHVVFTGQISFLSLNSQHRNMKGNIKRRKSVRNGWPDIITLINNNHLTALCLGLSG